MSSRSRRLVWALCQLALVIILAIVFVKLMPGASSALVKKIWDKGVREKHEAKRIEQPKAAPPEVPRVVPPPAGHQVNDEPESWDPKTQAMPPGMSRGN